MNLLQNPNTKYEQINRIEWIDMVKGVGIFLVVIGHAGNIPNVKIWIYSFHMPLFF